MSKARILVVDDDPEIVTMLSTRLTKRGYAVTTASDGHKAIELAKSYGGRPTDGASRLPAALIAGSPDFLRPLVHSEGRVPRQLHIYAIDLGRSPTGAWRVLRDRTQAPSGAGFAIENRIAILILAAPFVARMLSPGKAPMC